MTRDEPAAGALKAHVAEELRALLARKKISATTLAKQIGVSQTYMWRRLNGETAFDLDDLERISRVLDCKIVDLLPKGGPDTTSGKPRQAVRPSDNRPKGRGEAPLRKRPRIVSSPFGPTAMTVMSAESWA